MAGFPAAGALESAVWRPVVTSQSRTLLSQAAEAMWTPSGLKATS